MTTEKVPEEVVLEVEPAVIVPESVVTVVRKIPSGVKIKKTRNW